MAERLVYFNAEFIPELEARISIFDCALMYGDMVFEMTRTFNQKPYRLRQHLERLYASLDYVQINCGLTIDQMEAATHETIERNLPALEGYDVQIMHDVTRGGLALYDTIVREGTAPIVSINVLPFARHIGSQEPRPQGYARALEEGPRRRQEFSLARSAVQIPSRRCPRPFFRATPRAYEALWPPNTHQVVSTARLLGKPLVELLEGARVVHPGAESGLFAYARKQGNNSTCVKCIPTWRIKS